MSDTEQQMASRRVLAVIPAYRNPEALRQCLESLGAQTIRQGVLVYVRDNSDDNIYYTAACNEGIRYGLNRPEIEYFLLLNQDCVLAPDAVEILVQFMDAFDGVGICAPVQLDPDDHGRVTWCGAAQSFPRGFGWTGRLADFREPVLSPWANGAAMMLRRELLIDTGLLDESMRFVCSDSDLSFTARSRGWQIVCHPAAKCFHVSGKAGVPDNEALRQVIVADMERFAAKWITGDLFRSLEHEGMLRSVDEVMTEARECWKGAHGAATG